MIILFTGTFETSPTTPNCMTRQLNLLALNTSFPQRLKDLLNQDRSVSVFTRTSVNSNNFHNHHLSQD
jgi:hypothetical protein